MLLQRLAKLNPKTPIKNGDEPKPAPDLSARCRILNNVGEAKFERARYARRGIGHVAQVFSGPAMFAELPGTMASGTVKLFRNLERITSPLTNN